MPWGYDDSRVRQMDHAGISNQLQRLPLQRPAHPFSAYPVDGGWQGVSRLYGYEGPTIASVSALAEERVRRGDFYPLRVAEVEDFGSSIHVRFDDESGQARLTMSVDKRTGLWTPVR